MSKNQKNFHIGIDVSKHQLDIAILPSKVSFSCENSTTGFRGLIKKIAAYPQARIVLEATGGYEKPLAHALNKAGFHVSVVNPRQIRDFAKALGKLAKTDKIDAHIIALFAEKVQPEARKMKSENHEELAENTSRRKQLVDMITMEKNRLDKAGKSTKKSIKRIIKALEKELDEIEKQQKKIIDEDEQFSRTVELLTTVQGIGDKVATALVAFLPELGTLTGKQIASLAGLAPFNRDSGTLRGVRCIWGGRANVRCSMYMATLVATRHNPKIRQFYKRLCDAGKSKKVALVACMRKLLICINAMVKHNQPWQICEI